MHLERWGLVRDSQHNFLSGCSYRKFDLSLFFK